MGFEYIRVGTVKPNHKRVGLNKRAQCNLYTYPTFGTTFDSLQPVNITWDTTCLETSKVDIYLNAPTTEVPQLHLWKDIEYSAGYYETTLLPRWWNSTDSQQLQFIIIEAGNPTFAATLPAGPIFTATYKEPSSGVPEAADISVVDSNTTSAAEAKPSMSGGKIAAAVIVPLIFVGIAIAGYIKHQRTKREVKAKRYSTAVDQRMSTINPDWQSMSAAGATAAIRESMAGSGNRASGFSFGIRPSSSFYAVEDGGQAGIGARGMYQQDNEPISVARPRQSVYTADPSARVSTISFAPDARPRLNSVGTGERVSRVSFAKDSRPSVERVSTFGRPSVDTNRASTYTAGRGPSRAFHSAFVVPDLPPTDDAGAMSPTQREGPMTLTSEAIQARLSTNDRGGSEMTNDDVMPALNMMRAQEDDGQDAYSGYFNDSGPEMPQAPSSAYANDTLFAAPLSPTGTQSPDPIHSMFSGFAPAPVAPMSPDALLHAYSVRNQQARANGMMSPPPVPGSPIQFPMPAATGTAIPDSPHSPPRVMSPSHPGVYSPSRGAYGAAYDESPYSGAI